MKEKFPPHFIKNKFRWVLYVCVRVRACVSAFFKEVNDYHVGQLNILQAAHVVDGSFEWEAQLRQLKWLGFSLHVVSSSRRLVRASSHGSGHISVGESLMCTCSSNLCFHDDVC